MNILFALTIISVFVSYSSTTLQDEMAGLENDMSNDSESKVTSVKKSIKDLSTEELIAELEREFHDTSSGNDAMEKKYRQRFEDIITKKEKLDKIANADINSLLSDRKDEDVFGDLIKNLDEELNTQKKDVAADECVDVRTDCNQLINFCESHKIKLKTACALTCGYCVKCEQKASKSTCNMLKRWGKCNSHKKGDRPRMVRLCPKTCAFCKVPSPPKCSDTMHGCCWDKTTVKKDKKGSNCPECKDTYKYVCKTFKVDCQNFRRSGIFMRQFCPKQCDMCNDFKCEDAKEQQAVCPFWKDHLNWCTVQKNTMKFYCPKTCGIC